MGIRRATMNYQLSFAEHRSDLDAPLRTLFRLIRWVDETSLEPRHKWHYCALIRAQLSWIELVVLFYNGLTQNGEKFATYANRYALFDNIESNDPLIQFAITHITTMPDGDRPQIRDGLAPWPYLPSAFDSNAAKRALGLREDA
jgi:hypothetical protein